MIDATAVARLREQYAAATAGEWWVDKLQWQCVISAPNRVIASAHPYSIVHDDEPNAAYIAAAHNALPDVLDALEQAWRERDALAAELAQVRGELAAVPVHAINTVVRAATHAYDMREDRQDVTAITDWMRKRNARPLPPQVDWSVAPAFALWWAADEDGDSTWFECKPVLAKDEKGGYWDNPKQAATRRYARYDLGGFDWTQTLQGRPGVIDMRAAEMGIDAQY